MEPNEIVQQPSSQPPTLSQPVTPSAPVIAPQPKPSKLPIILLTLVSLLSLSGLIYFYFQTQSLKQQITMQPTPTPTPSDTPKVQPSPTDNPTSEWKTITNKHWTFKVPPQYNYLECSSHDLILVGLPTTPSLMFTKDQTIECNFDQTGETLSIYRGLDNSENNIIIPTNTDPKFDPIVANVETILVGGRDAIFQKETTSFGQGIGSRYKVYIHYQNYTDVITFNDLSQKALLNQILNTLSFSQ